MVGPTTEIVNIHNAPKVIGDYAMVRSKPMNDVVDLFSVVIELRDSLNIMCVFSGDLWPVVFDGVKNYIQFKRNYISACVDVIDNRVARGPLSHQIVEQYRDLWHQRALAQELPRPQL